MIKNYELADGGKIAASTSEEFVQLLREGSWFDSDCTDEEFMERFASRYKLLHGVDVSCDTAEHFVADLNKYGYIKE
jgi:uncharacterized protein YutE (UPF0331/DUF86 family)